MRVVKRLSSITGGNRINVVPNLVNPVVKNKCHDFFGMEELSTLVLRQCEQCINYMQCSCQSQVLLQKEAEELRLLKFNIVADEKNCYCQVTFLIISDLS